MTSKSGSSHQPCGTLQDCGQAGEAAPLPFPEHALIIGSRGRMGSMLMAEAGRNRLSVAGCDLPLTEAKLKQACEPADAVILSIPARHLEETIKLLAPLLAPGTILSDITSVKEKPMQLMQKYWHGPVVGTHPLFGPRFDPQDRRSVAITPGEKADYESIQKIHGFFRRLGCETFETTPEQHDLAMAKIQNMNFITNLAYFALMADQQDLLPFLTPSFERRKKAAAKMLTEDAEMFSGLFEANPHSHEAVRQYRRMLNVAASGDIDLLCKKAQWWWQDREEKKEA